MPAKNKKQFAKYPSYKPTGIDWLGEIPSEWDFGQSKFIFRIINGATPKSNVEKYWDGDVLWATPNDLGKNIGMYLSATARNITDAGYQSCGTTKAPAYSIILSTRAPIGHLAVSNKEMCINQGCKILVKNHPKVDYKFYYYLLSVIKPVLESFGQGSTFSELSGSKLASLKFPFLNSIEQLRISTFLDKETEKIDKLIEKKQILIERLKEKRTALISQAVTKGLDPKVKMKDSGIPWLGQIPEHWKVEKAKLCFKDGKDGIKIGPFGSSLKAEFIKETGYKIYGQEQVIANDFNIGEKYIDGEKFAELAQYEIKRGDVLVTMMGTTGKCQIVPDGIKTGIMDSHLIRIRPASDISLPQYFSLLIRESDYIRTQFDLSGKGSIMEGLNSSIISSLVILLPPIDEQKAILGTVNEKNNSISILIEKIDKQIEKIKEYRTALISAAVTGKIKVC